MTPQEQIARKMIIAANGDAVCLDEAARFNGWVMYNNHGAWVSKRPALPYEIMAAKRQLSALRFLKTLQNKDDEMTTLSKEEFKLLLSNSVASQDLDKVQDAIADLVAENERLTDSNQMYLDRIEHLERKDRCHNEYAKRPILYTDGVNGEQCCRDDLWAVSTAELSAMTDQLTATRTALAAAEADNKQLRKALNEILTTDWVSDRVRRTAKIAIAQPSDDSALREMIAGVYEECAKVCEDDAKGWTDYSCEMAARDCADAIRALAEKKLASLTS